MGRTGASIAAMKDFAGSRLCLIACFERPLLNREGPFFVFTTVNYGPGIKGLALLAG